jgi:hypothetical protein
VLRLIIPMLTWEGLSDARFDEIRQFGMTSFQVMRRLRAALTGSAESTTIAARAEAVERYLKHLDLAIERSPLDVKDRRMALQEDRHACSTKSMRFILASSPTYTATSGATVSPRFSGNRTSAKIVLEVRLAPSGGLECTSCSRSQA